MKKVILTLGLVFSLTSVFAQTNTADREVGTTTKAGQKILPQAGDFAIGIDVISFAGEGNYDALSFIYNDAFLGGDKPTIYGKYFLSDQSAIRAKLHIGFTSNTLKNEGEPKTGTTDQFVTDKETTSTTGLGLTVGYEIRRGYGRLQGFFGPEVGLGFLSSKTTFDYGNPIDKDNTAQRPLEVKTMGSNFYAKLGGFAGVEYFIAPKISLGGELGLGLNMATTGKTKEQGEKWNATDQNVEKVDKDGKVSSSAFDFNVGYSTSVNVTFYF